MVQAFQKPSLLPWQVKNHWFSCLAFYAHRHLFISHIYRERNTYADFMDNIGLTCDSLINFYSTPNGIMNDFVQNRI